MAEKMATGWVRPDSASVRLAAPPELAIRLVSALLALAVAGVHVADQGGITAFNSPPGLAGLGLPDYRGSRGPHRTAAAPAAVRMARLGSGSTAWHRPVPELPGLALDRASR